MNNSIQHIEQKGKLLAIVIPNQHAPPQTEFITDDELNLQAGYIVYAKGDQVKRHAHHPVERTIKGTTEVLLVKSGRCIADIYDDQQQLVTSCELSERDIIMLIAGGHGFRMLEDCALFEIKQGPYAGPNEKFWF